MNPRTLELALRKQRLQFRIQAQRDDLLRGLARIDLALAAVDRVRDGADWVRDNAPLAVLAGVTLAVARPRFALRWGRRAWVVWQTYRRVKGVATAAAAAL